MNNTLYTSSEYLPGEITVDGFDDVYIDYIKGGTNPFWLLNIVAWPILAVGVISLIFGPSSVMVGYGSMTLMQFIQLYPGPIITVGFFASSAVAT